MPLHVALTHSTTYRYDRPVALGPQTIRLRPAPQARTPIVSYSLTVAPKPHFINWLQDPQGNHLARVVFPEPVTHFDVTVDLVAEMVAINPFDFFLEPEAETWPFAYDPVLEQELAPFRRLASPGPLLAKLLAELPSGPPGTVDKLIQLNRLVQERVSYIVRLEPGVLTPEETLASGRGSCRDSAWLLVRVLRQLGFAARFVSGYLIQLVPDVRPLQGPAGPEADFADLHAWAEVYLPGAGWIGLDATSGLMTSEGHIPLAASPDPISAAPITGLVEKAEVTFDFDMVVRRVLETPRATRPYTERHWREILAAGERVDQALAAADMRLTMASKLTFVSAAGELAAEWAGDTLGPAASWSEIVARGEAAYEAARQIGLAPEKFLLDGRHVGTGGGNHVVMGAARAEDSPFLRRPDLLKSLVGFWHNRPSLSYLFSGQFIGPFSQHPRVDEARPDALAELEMAFARIPRVADVSPARTDQPLRDILADMTGNTRRTEFCIDRLNPSESDPGGLVEFRAIEMPPHARMAAAQILLIRAALAAFWQAPYERRLVRWGTRLHDDFMLPHYVEQDFSDALEELAALGFRLDPAWFTPHMEFRFPRIGEVSLRGATLELRHALEPWPMLAEQPTDGGGTRRYVDSSTERVQARVSGWTEERYVLACNGHAVPLTQTERAGEYVGGVRFRAWAPPSTPHPTLPARTPLVFDIHDRWSGRGLGGLTYHVVDPGGRSYDTLPVNANEAEARRRSRFFPFGHTPGAMAEPPVVPSREHPRTLDLRRVRS